MDSYLRKKQRELVASGSPPAEVEAFIHAVMRSQDKNFILECIQKWLQIYNEKAKVSYFLKPQQSSTASSYFTLHENGYCGFKEIYCVLLTNEHNQAITDRFEIHNRLGDGRKLMLSHDLHLEVGEMISIPLNLVAENGAVHEFVLTNGGPLQVNVVGETI
jgi:hypothetical protein